MNELCSKEHIINLDDGFFLCGGGDRMFWAIVCGRRKLSRTICNFMQIGLRAQKYEAVDEHCTRRNRNWEFCERVLNSVVLWKEAEGGGGGLARWSANLVYIWKLIKIILYTLESARKAYYLFGEGANILQEKLCAVVANAQFLFEYTHSETSG